MKFTLDENGSCLRDVEVKLFVQEKIANNQDIHTGQTLVMDWTRAILKEMPVESRPDVEWWIYGKQVHFDADMRSFDAWKDPRTSIQEDALMILI